MRRRERTPTKVRAKQYREGGWAKPHGRNGLWGSRSGISNYEKSKYTFAHEMSHEYLNTVDYGAFDNAYSFESWVWDSPHIHTDIYGIGWRNGVPLSKHNEYTIW